MSDSSDRTVLEHYRIQAEKHGPGPGSTMEDEVIRAKEMAALAAFLRALGAATAGAPAEILELGCGNGYALDEMARAFPAHRFTGLDFSTDMLAIGRGRLPATIPLLRGDARNLPFADRSFDALYTERCLINILSWEGQQRALTELGRVLRPGGHALLIECFDDGLANNNRARVECGLDSLAPAHHNRYFENAAFESAVAPRFEMLDPTDWAGAEGAYLARNFLSSHYFVARVLHPLVTRGEWVRNTEFVKFFSALPPAGNYSPIQAVLLRRRQG